jgi:hypothetical protein
LNAQRPGAQIIVIQNQTDASLRLFVTKIRNANAPMLGSQRRKNYLQVENYYNFNFFDISDVPSKNLTETKQFKCTDTWCSSYCDSKSNGRKFTSACNENQECKCEYAWQPTGKKPTN